MITVFSRSGADGERAVSLSPPFAGFPPPGLQKFVRIGGVPAPRAQLFSRV